MDQGATCQLRLHVYVCVNGAWNGVRMCVFIYIERLCVYTYEYAYVRECVCGCVRMSVYGCMCAEATYLIYITCIMYTVHSIVNTIKCTVYTAL